MNASRHDRFEVRAILFIEHDDTGKARERGRSSHETMKAFDGLMKRGHDERVRGREPWQRPQEIFAVHHVHKRRRCCCVRADMHVERGAELSPERRHTIPFNARPPTHQPTRKPVDRPSWQRHVRANRAIRLKMREERIVARATSMMPHRLGERDDPQIVSGPSYQHTPT